MSEVLLKAHADVDEGSIWFISFSSVVPLNKLCS